MQTMENRYAQLLTQYCLDLKAGDQVYVRSSMLAEPLLREIWREGLKLGANLIIDMDFPENGSGNREPIQESWQFLPKLAFLHPSHSLSKQPHTFISEFHGIYGFHNKIHRSIFKGFYQQLLV